MKGKNVIIISRNFKVAGLVLLSDIIKPNAAKVIEELKKMELEVAILSGDYKESTKAIASEINIENIYAEVRPDQKLEVIKKMQENGKTIAMVGDGINDAPALIQADIGIALGSGTDAAMSAADITLGSGDLEAVLKAILISKKTMKIIKQNLFWAFFYNVICIPIAAGALFPFWGILLNPSFAALAMAFSSVSVVTNSLRLKIIKIRS